MDSMDNKVQAQSLLLQYFPPMDPQLQKHQGFKKTIQISQEETQWCPGMNTRGYWRREMNLTGGLQPWRLSSEQGQQRPTLQATSRP